MIKARQFFILIVCIAGSIVLFSGCFFNTSTELFEKQTLKIVYAMEINEEPLAPVDIRNEFSEGSEFFLLFYSNFPFGKQEYTIAIYGIDEDTDEFVILDQASKEVDPSFDSVAFPMALPQGTYLFEIDFGDGLIASKEVNIYPLE